MLNEYHKEQTRLKLLAVEEMSKNPLTLEQVIEQLKRANEQYRKREEEEQIIINEFINNIYSKLMNFTNRQYHILHPQIKSRLIKIFAKK